jgi:hypothetical protein
MARWLLTEPHYLNVPGNKWEYKETDRFTGKQLRKELPVPMLLDNRDEADWNYTPKSGPFEAESGLEVFDSFGIVVCHAGKGKGRDIVFVGPPTPGMLPIDHEAKAISNKEKVKWKHPIEDLPGTYSENLLASLQGKVADAMSKIALPASDSKMDALIASIAAMADQNAKLIAALSSRRV